MNDVGTSGPSTSFSFVPDIWKMVLRAENAMIEEMIAR